MHLGDIRRIAVANLSCKRAGFCQPACLKCAWRWAAPSPQGLQVTSSWARLGAIGSSILTDSGSCRDKASDRGKPFRDQGLVDKMHGQPGEHQRAPTKLRPGYGPGRLPCSKSRERTACLIQLYSVFPLQHASTQRSFYTNGQLVKQ